MIHRAAFAAVLLALITAHAHAQTEPVKASCFGFNPADATAALRAAIASGAPRILIDNTGYPWITDRLTLRSDLELIFAPGVVVQAKPGAFKGRTDCLFLAPDCRNLKLTGPANGTATLKMNRFDYDDPAKYEKSEHRHAISLRGCRDVSITNLTIAESGGDGIYIAGGKSDTASRHVVIRDVVCDRNYRQGISVISADDLLIENVTLSNTRGTAPQAGIDFEPNRPQDQLTRCVMRRCTSVDNAGLGYHMYLRHLDASSQPITIRLEECVSRGSNSGSLNVTTANGAAGCAAGSIEFVNCRFDDSDHPSIHLGSKPATGPSLAFTRCTLAAPKPGPAAPTAGPGSPAISITSRPGDTDAIERIHLDVDVHLAPNQPLLHIADKAGVGVFNITGSLHVTDPAGTREVMLDQRFIDAHAPGNPFCRLKRFSLDNARLAAPAINSPLAPHRLRDEAAYLLIANAGDKPVITLEARSPSKAAVAGELPIDIVGPDGKVTKTRTAKLGEKTDVTFPAHASGAYRIRIHARQNWVRAVASTHPLNIVGDQTAIHLMSTAADFYAIVPAGSRKFGLLVHGGGELEPVNITVTDHATGQKLWSPGDVNEPQFFITTREDASRPMLLHIKTARPTSPPKAILEDYYLEFRGMPPILATDPAQLIAPAP
jgi:hypothetical protein